MTQEEILAKEALEKVIAEKTEPLKSEIKMLKEVKSVNQSDFETLQKELAETKEAAKAQGLKLKEFETKSHTLSGDFEMQVKEVAQKIAELKPGERLQIKSVGDMLTSSNVTGTGAQPQYLTPMSEVRLAPPLAFQLCNIFRTSEGIITDVAQDSEEGGAARTTEGSSKEQYDFNIYGTQYTMLPVNAYVTISRNMLKNFPYLENFIRTRLMKKVMDKASSQIFEGSGVSPIMKGISQFATAWSAGDWALAITNPNLYHVLLIGVAQSRALNYEPNAIIINPTDAAGLKIAALDANNMPAELVLSNGRMTVSGVPVYENSNITAGSFQLGDYNLSNLAIQGDFELFVDPYSGLKTNKITLLGEMFMVHYVSKTDAGAFIYGDISDAITALTKSAA